MGEASVETMCVINAAIVFFVIDAHRGEPRGDNQRGALLRQIIAAARARGDSQLAWPLVFGRFLKLLGFWGEVRGFLGRGTRGVSGVGGVRVGGVSE